MNNISAPDKTINQVLARLRDVSVPTGMEARVLQHLEAKQTDSPWRWRIWPPQQQKWVIPSAALAATACITMLIVLHPRITTNPGTHTAGPIAATPVQASNEATATHVQVKALRIMPASALRISHNVAADASHDSNEADALMQDMLAPSQPAPPIPLTRQEKLLLRAAYHVDRVEIAQLEALPPLPHRDDAVTQYIHQMLAPLVMAEKLNPTPKPEADDAPVRDETPETVQPPQ